MLLKKENTPLENGTTCLASVEDIGFISKLEKKIRRGERVSVVFGECPK